MKNDTVGTFPAVLEINGFEETLLPLGSFKIKDDS
jgi:hypothetical protein